MTPHLKGYVRAYVDRALPPAMLHLYDKHLVCCTVCRAAADQERRIVASLRSDTGVPMSLRTSLMGLGAAPSGEPQPAPTAPSRSDGPRIPLPPTGFRMPSAPSYDPVPTVRPTAPALHRSPMRAAVVASIAAGASVAAAWGLAISPVPGSRTPSVRGPVASLRLQPRQRRQLRWLRAARQPGRSRHASVAGPRRHRRQRALLGRHDPHVGPHRLAGPRHDVRSGGPGSGHHRPFGTIRAMSDESTTPDPDPTAPPEPSERTQAHGAAAAPEVEQTGIIDLHDTRAIPAGSPAPAPSATEAQPPASAAGSGSGESGDDAWFDVFGGEHPTEGAGVPARADAAWGSDRADSLAEQAHRSAYAPPAPAADAPPAPARPGEAQASAATAAGATAYLGSVPHAPADGDPGPEGAVPPGGVALTDAAAPPARRGRGKVVAAVVGLCLLSGVIGGIAGQVAEDRINVAGSTLPDPGPGATQRPAGSVANIAAVALPSVVTIKVDGGSEGSATGSGFVIDAKGHVLTNNHVVEPGVNGDIEIVLSNGDTEKATIVGRDASLRPRRAQDRPHRPQAPDARRVRPGRRRRPGHRRRCAARSRPDRDHGDRQRAQPARAAGRPR